MFIWPVILPKLKCEFCATGGDECKEAFQKLAEGKKAGILVGYGAQLMSSVSWFACATD